ncbi:MAG: Branched-chain amino acid transporter, amino acid-binding protein [Myxococcaceae bacterium]|nr:Branched-chain amino acid transporter, amino acid-binding protein [Myxococcaceae bacterium]
MLRFLLAGHCFLLWNCTPPASGGWRQVASMNDVHESHGAVVLPDGRVLVVGGHHVDATKRLVDTVEFYDGAADRWTKTAAMLEKREGAGSVQLLADGRLLLPGEHNTLTGSELFDVATETWSATGSLNVGRGGHVSELLDDGRVLVAGGINWLSSPPPSFDSAELYDPVSGQWTFTGAMTNKRAGPMEVKLADGRVMVLGGFDDANAVRFFRSAEIFNPTSGTWTLAAEASRALGSAALVRLRDGRVLLAGGVTRSGGMDTSHAEAEIYDPATNTWSPTGAMATARSQFPLLLLDDGRVLAVGGVLRPAGKALAEAEIFDPATGTWSSAGRLAVQRWNHRVLRFGSGALVVGGYNASGQLSSVEAIEHL